MRIRTKILIIALSLILITAAASVMVSQIFTRNIVKKQIASKLESVAESRTDRIQTFLETSREAVRQLSASIVIERFLLASEDDQEYLRKFDDVMRKLKNTAGVGEHPYDIFVLDESGIIVASSNQRDIGTDRSTDPCFLNGREALFIKDAYVSQEGERNSLAFSAPILDEDNTALLGVVVARFPTEELNKITTDRTGLGETGEVYLVNQEGYMITPSRFLEDTFLKLKVDTQNLRAGLEDSKRFGAREHEHEVILSKNYLDTEVLGIHEHMPEMNWCLLAEVSEKEAFAPIVTLTHSMLFILGVLLVVGMVVSILISGTITKPISKLHHGTEEVAGGNLEYKVGTGAKDEIGQLSRTFDGMTANLKESRAKLQKYQRTLEEKIEVRTKELALANAGLRRELEERQQAEQRLRIFSHSVESSVDGVVIGDLEGNITHVNEAFARMFGYSQEELTGTEIAFLYAENQLHKLEGALQATRQGGWTGELIGRRKGGGLFPVEVSWSIIVDDEGRIIAQVATHRDITERKVAEEVVRESEERYRTLLENLPQKISYKDKRSVYVSCNQNYALDLKIKPEEIVGKTDYDFYPKELADKYRADERRLMESGETEETEERYIQDEKELFVHTVKTPVRDEGGNVVGILGVFWDVTERRGAEQALRESEQRFRSIFDQATDGILLTDPENKKFYTGNRMICEMLGYGLEEIRNLRLMDIHPAQDLPQVLEQFEKQTRGEIKLATDIPVKRRDGTVFYADINSARIVLEGKTYLVGLFRDVTERKQAEKALQESEEKYRDLFENASDLIQSVNPQGRFLYVNRAWRETLGYDEEEVAGLNLFDIIHPDSQAHCMEVFQRVLSGETVDGIEAIFVAKDGRQIAVEGGANCKFLAGVPISTRGIFRDITERKRAEEALRESEKRYRTLVETAQEGINIVSPEEDIIFSNKAFASMLGYEPWELEGKNLQELVTEEQYKTFQVESQKRMKGIVSRYEIEMRHRDGSYRSALLSATPLYDSQGNHQGTLGMLVDITERKKAGEALRQAEAERRRMTEALREAEKLALVGEMAGRVAHEVLNPVTALLSRTQSELDYANLSQATVVAVKGIIADWQENIKKGTLSQYLLQKSPGTSDTTYGEEDLAILFQAVDKNADNLKRNQEFLSFFERHIMRVVKIIDNLRQMARARREIEEVDVNSCLKEVAGLFQEGLDKRKITLLRRLVPGLPKVYVDRTELFQVFSNLLRNAMRAIDKRGEGKGEVTFTSEVTGEEIWVRVIDNGVAIPVAERHLVFEPDFSAKVGKEGRGLELPISRRLVREMGGELHLESSPSESGSTFLVKLPLTKGAEIAETDTEKAAQV
jgi:PAS domain S-box-containing protein